jgi:hypothetical protein
VEAEEYKRVDSMYSQDNDDSYDEKLSIPGEDPIERNDIVNTGENYAFLIGNATEQMRMSRRPAGYIFVDI